MNVRERMREQTRAKRFVADLDHLGRLSDFMDACVLGDLDWHEWGFEERPSRAFREEAFKEAQYREIMRDG